MSSIIFLLNFVSGGLFLIRVFYERNMFAGKLIPGSKRNQLSLLKNITYAF